MNTKHGRIILCCLCVLLSGISYSQSDSVPGLDKPEKERKYIIKITPPFFFPSVVDLAFEHRVAPRTGLQYEAGYLLPSVQSPREEGFRIRTEARFYQKKEAKPLWGGYFATELIYAHTFQKGTEWFGMDCSDGSCSYRQEFDYRKTRQTIGYHIKWGTQRNLGRSIVFDFFLGMGVRYLRVRSQDLPEELQDTTIDTQIGVFSFAGDAHHGDYFQPSFTLGVRFGYIIK